VLDWRKYFMGNPAVRGHETLDPTDWNGKMLPELRNIEARVSSETNKRLVRARGLSRLSAWFAFGYIFCDVARYTIEVDQQGQLWQSDAQPSADFILTSNGLFGEALDSEGGTVAVGISVSVDLEGDIRRHVQRRTERINALLFVRPTRNLDRHCVRDVGDAVALADGAKSMIRDFAKHYGAERVLLYYVGPLSGACFLGHRLNAVCREIQIMEWSDPNYVPSFSLT